MISIRKTILQTIAAGFVSNVIILASLQAQSVTFSYFPDTQNFASDQFQVDLHEDLDHNRSIRIREHEVVFGDVDNLISGFMQVSISPDRTFIGALFETGDHVSAEIYRSDGTLINRISQLAVFDPDDPSVGLYMMNNGTFIYRDNIAGFTFFDERGNEIHRLSNSTGSPDGEMISELAATPYGATVFLYNPGFYVGSQVRSRIQKVDNDGEVRPVTVFENAGIEDLHLHPGGRLLLVHVFDESDENHRAKVFSYSGKLLAEVNYENDEIEEMTLSPCGYYVTARTSGRVIVHRISNGKRLGSASFRERVLTASYMPDGVLAVLTGSRTGNNELNNLRAHMINIRERRVVREESSISVSISPYFRLQLSFDSPSAYRLEGINRPLIIQHTL